MKVSKLRSIVLLASATLIASLALAAPAPAAPGSSFHLAFVAGRGPTDALATETITSVPFAPTADKVQVELLNNSNNRMTNQAVTVTLSLQLDAAPSTGLAVTPVTTVSGVATFDVLSVATTNIAEISDYTLVASSTSDPDVAPATSADFDVWGDGTTCEGGECTHNPDTLDPVPDSYKDNDSTIGEVITTSTFEATSSNIDCDGYTELTTFSVWHESTHGGVLFVVTHTARDEMKNLASNGQAGVQLCLAMSHAWTSQQLRGQPLQPVLKDTDGDGNLDSFVGLAPKCPKKNPAAAAPCITAQYGDGKGGNYTEAWLPGTDPGKRS